MDDCHHLFKKLAPLEPPPHLKVAIFTTIASHRRRQSYRRYMAYLVVALLSCGAILPISYYVFKQINQSGFWTYVSLIWSDTLTILPMWREFGAALLESLPLAGISLLCGVFGLALTAMRGMSSYAEKYKYLMV